MRVLVADTDEAVCEVIQSCLEEEYPGVAVTCLHSGDLARAALRAGDFDLAVIEAVLPEVCGFDLAEQATSQNTPVLLMSGDLTAQDKLDDFGYPNLGKPFLLRELIQATRGIRSDTIENVREVRVAGARRRVAGNPSSDQADSRRTWHGPKTETAIKSGVNILLVEADQTAREGLWVDLENAGYTAIAAARFEEAWLLLETTQWDLLLTAIDLRGCSGSQLALKARAKGTPSIFIADNVVPMVRHMAGPQYEVLLEQVAACVRAFTQSPVQHAA
ncbi:MAG: response regulator [Acetobacteraceae bacterium]